MNNYKNCLILVLFMPTDFQEKVYSKLRKVPKGRVTTYKSLGNSLGIKAYQAIGQALRNNPYAPQVPCHRVVSSDGSIGGFNGKTTGPEIQRKIKILESEGIFVKNNKVKEFNKKKIEII